MIKIFQINTDRDKNKNKFMAYGWIKEFDFSIYDEVWSGKPKWETLEDIFEIFNLHHPEDFNGHSLSVSDIVQIINEPDKEEDGFYFCDSFGWRKLNIKR